MQTEASEAHESGDGVWEGTKARAARLGAERRADSKLSPPCPLCGTDAEDPYHALTTCTDPGTVAARFSFTSSVPQRLGHIIRLYILPRHVLDRLTYTRKFGEIDRREALIQHIEALATGTDWISDDGKFVLFHLLAVATWTSRPCRHDMPLSRALASVFAAPEFELKNHHIRPMANSWANWGATGVLSIFDAWNQTVSPSISAATEAARPRRTSRRAAAIVGSPQAHRKQRRHPRLVGSRLPSSLADYVVDLTV